MKTFSSEWAAALQRELNADEGYRTAGRRWSGGLALLQTDADTGAERGGDGEAGTGGGAAVYLDLQAGECRAARPASEADLAGSRAIVAGPPATWARILGGDLDPMLALASGRLSLEKGSLASLMTHARGARALLKAAARVGTDVPAMAAVGGVSVAHAVADDASATAGISLDSPAAGVEPESPAERRAKPPAERRYQTAGGPGLDHSLLPMRLWRKAKKLGVWDPEEIGFARDAEDWKELAEEEKDLILRLSALFQGGEEAVALDLLPLIETVAAEGRLEEEMYLTSFLFEEAKHVETFQRFFTEVAPDHGDLARFATPAWRRIFSSELPDALGRLRTDRSPAAQARAAVTYNMIVEGVLAETGYHAYHVMLERNRILPGMQQAMSLLKRDESRHIAYGLYLLSRLTAEHGDPVWQAIESEMGRLLDPALAIIDEIFEAYEEVPFGLRQEDFTEFALDQFRRRLARLERAREEGGLVTEIPA